MYVNTEFVTDRQWDGYATRIERQNMKNHHHSLTRTGIASRARSFIVEIRSYQNGMIVRLGWRDAMKAELIPVEETK